VSWTGMHSARKYQQALGILALIAIGTVLAMGFLSSGHRRRLAVTQNPVSSLIGLLSEGHGLVEDSLDTRWVTIGGSSRGPSTLRDARTGFEIGVSDLLGATHDCPLRTIQESHEYLVSAECLIVFVVSKERKKIEAVTTLPDYSERGADIVAVVARGAPSIATVQGLETVPGGSKARAGHLSKKAARDLAARFRGLCNARNLSEMQSLADPLRILVDGHRGVVIDLRTGYHISFDRIRELRNTCPNQNAADDGTVQIVTFCEHGGYREAQVVFVISPDRKIRAIMDEATWQARGQEILKQIT